MNEARAVTDPRMLLRSLFSSALTAVDPMQCVPRHLPPPPRGRTLVIGAGKASARMARAVEMAWDGPLSGLVVTRYGHGESCERIEIVEAGHPVPDVAGQHAARRILENVRGLGPDDLMLCLISGGGSSLLTLPAPGITLDDKKEINVALLKSGASIAEMNRVRRHLSAIKGGRLAAAARATPVVTLVISDVPGDDPALVASGPTIADDTTPGDALTILKRYGIALSSGVRAALERNTSVPSGGIGARHEHIVIATAQHALDAAAAHAVCIGVRPLLLGGSIEGEARDVALMHAGIARQIKHRGQPLSRPSVILSGGETTVTVRGDGRGGRNTEFLLSLAVGLGAEEGVYALACDTDGIDGVEDNAGACIDPTTLARATAKRMDAHAFLARNDAYSYFQNLDDLVVTGPTRTNVNDFRAILVS